MPNKNKNTIDYLIKIFEKIFKSDQAVGISLLFCFVLTTIILNFSNRLIMNIREALIFMFGISFLFLILNFILNNTKNYPKLFRTIFFFFQKFQNIPCCKTCKQNMNIYANKANTTYIWKCIKHSKKGKNVKIKCPICKNKQSVSIKNKQLATCHHCLHNFSSFEVNEIIEDTFSSLIITKLPKYQNIKTYYTQTKLQESIKNIIFLLVFIILISSLNYLVFSPQGSKLLASLFSVSLISHS